MLVHQPPRLGERVAIVEEAGTVELDIGEEERHGSTLGDLLRLGEVGAGAVGVALGAA
jgi:hypothetical protein